MAVNIDPKPSKGKKAKGKVTLDQLLADHKKASENPAHILHEIAKDVSEKIGIEVDTSAFDKMQDYLAANDSGLDGVTVYSEPPSNPAPGSTYFDTQAGVMKHWSGSAWLEMTSIGVDTASKPDETALGLYTVGNGGTDLTISSYATLSGTLTPAKVQFSPEWTEAIKEAIEPWLIDMIKEVMANQPQTLPPVPAPTLDHAKVETMIEQAVMIHKNYDHAPITYPMQMTEYSLPNDLKEYKLILKGPYGSTQQYEVPMAMLPKLLAKVTL